MTEVDKTTKVLSTLASMIADTMSINVNKDNQHTLAVYNSCVVKYSRYYLAHAHKPLQCCLEYYDPKEKEVIKLEVTAKILQLETRSVFKHPEYIVLDDKGKKGISPGQFITEELIKSQIPFRLFALRTQPSVSLSNQFHASYAELPTIIYRAAHSIMNGKLHGLKLDSEKHEELFRFCNYCDLNTFYLHNDADLPEVNKKTAKLTKAECSKMLISRKLTVTAPEGSDFTVEFNDPGTGRLPIPSTIRANSRKVEVDRCLAKPLVLVFTPMANCVARNDPTETATNAVYFSRFENNMYTKEQLTQVCEHPTRVFTLSLDLLGGRID